jgi:Spy/CpxP family protein refolding chaperone
MGILCVLDTDGKEPDMLRKRNAIVLALAVAAVLVFGGCYRTPEQRAEHIVKRIASDLDLNDAQKAQLDRIKDEFVARRPEMKKLREETVKEANALMRSPEIDKAKLNDLTVKNQTQVTDMVGFVSAKFAEIHDMLTPEQREKLVSHIEKYEKRGHHW